MRDNVNPKVWGPEGWAFLKSCARACDEESFPHYLQFVALLPHVLPCEKCRHHAEDYIRRNPPRSAAEFLDWVNAFEAAVRRRKVQEEDGAVTDRPPLGGLLAYLGLGFALALLLACCLAALLCALAPRARPA